MASGKSESAKGEVRSEKCERISDKRAWRIEKWEVNESAEVRRGK